MKRMSDDESPSKPTSAQLEAALRSEVTRCFEAQDMENLTLKRVRAVAEEKLYLSSGWFKQHQEWNQKSKDVVNDEVTRREERNDYSQDSDKIDVPVKRGKVAQAAAPARKRKSPEASPQQVKKRQKGHVTPPKTEPLPEIDKRADDDDDDSSSLSEVLDPSPPHKKKREKIAKGKLSKSSSGKPKAKKQSKPATAGLSSEEAEIKTLQSWLVKCGMRKVWGKELSRFDTAREKIHHLKGMLSDVGMDGRFSEEKAKKIKERRELAADLEEIQQGEKYWGMNEGEESRQRGRRRLSRAAVAAPSESSESLESADLPPKSASGVEDSEEER